MTSADNVDCYTVTWLAHLKWIQRKEATRPLQNDDSDNWEGRAVGENLILQNELWLNHLQKKVTLLQDTSKAYLVIQGKNSTKMPLGEVSQDTLKVDRFSSQLKAIKMLILPNEENVKMLPPSERYDKA